MNKNFKRLLIMISVIILTPSIAIASAKLDTTTVFLKNINIHIEKDPVFSMNGMIYNDHIYVPLKFISEKLQSTVQWDEKNNTVIIKHNKNFKDFPEGNPLADETFVYGEIKEIDKVNGILSIEEHIDDHSMNSLPNLKVSENVVIILQRNDKKMNLDFDDLRVGDIVGMVINKDKIVRGIIIND